MVSDLGLLATAHWGDALFVDACGCVLVTMVNLSGTSAVRQRYEGQLCRHAVARSSQRRFHQIRDSSSQRLVNHGNQYGRGLPGKVLGANRSQSETG